MAQASVRRRGALRADGHYNTAGDAKVQGEQDTAREWLALDEVHRGDAKELLKQIRPESIALSVWSPPYWVGKSYEKDLSYEDWQNLLSTAIKEHYNPLKPGGFLVINIADILSFADPTMPRFQANVESAKRVDITVEDIREAQARHPDYNRYQLAELLGCSEQTIQRRLEGVQVRGGKYEEQTRIQLVGGMVEEWGKKAGFYLYDRRVWIKDPAWANDQWHSVSYRSVDEFEYVYIFWKPGETKVARSRLTPKEWSDWGSRGVWHFHPVKVNDVHEAMFPAELPRRCIRLFTDPGETVLDCFAGSGTSLVEAAKLGRHYIGIELLSKYVRLAKRNLVKVDGHSSQRKLFE